TLSGHLTDENAAGTIIAFSGAINAIATTDSNGDYSFTTTDWSLGDVTASATDVWGQSSNKPKATVTASGPVISNFQAIHVTLNRWTFQRQLTQGNAETLVVQLGGVASLQGRTVTVDADGWFCLTIDLQDGEQGTATARTTDSSGVGSNLA